MTMDPSIAAFIDLDNTVIRYPSFRRFLLIYAARASPRSFFRILLFRLLRQVRLISVQQFKEASLQFLRGRSRAELGSLGMTFCDLLHQTAVRGEALDCIYNHSKRGHLVFIATASPDFYVEPLAQGLRAAGSISTHLLYDDMGRFAGRFNGQDCAGTEKARRVKELAQARAIRLGDSFAYSDSLEDLPLLEMVGNPVAVHPDRKLEKICRERDWPIINWT